MTDETESPARIDGPAKETERHVWNRPATDDKGRPITGMVACTKLTPLELAFDRGQLKGGNPKYTDVARVVAGTNYAKIYNTSEPHGRDSTQALNISRSSTLGMNNDAQERSWDARLAIESYLSQADRTIIRMVCGEDATPAAAVSAACNDYKHTVPARFREALDNLIEAMVEAEKNPRRFDMKRRA